MKQQFLEDKTGTIILTVYDNNVAIVPTSAKVTLYYPGGGVLQAQDTATVNATTGEMTYSLTATHTANPDLNYKAVWEYVSSTVTYYRNQLFDVVKSILAIPITDNDLYNELESLRKINKQEKGTCNSTSSTSTLVDTRRKESDNFWKGGVLEIISGTGSGQTRDISSFVQSTGTITVTPNFVTTPDTTSVYRIVRSFSTKISQSFEKIEDMLYSKGKRQDLILESSQIKFILIYLTIHYICLDELDEDTDKWSKLADIYEKKFNEAYNNLRLDYDEDESGNIEGGEESGADVTSLRIQRC